MEEAFSEIVSPFTAARQSISAGRFFVSSDGEQLRLYTPTARSENAACRAAAALPMAMTAKAAAGEVTGTNKKPTVMPDGKRSVSVVKVRGPLPPGKSQRTLPDLVSPPRGTGGVIRGSSDARKKAERQDGGQSAAFSFFAMAAEMKPRNSGWGRLGRDLNSGWNCTPT